MHRRERPARLVMSAAAAFVFVALPVTARAQAQPTTPGIGTPTPQSGTPLGPAGRTPVGPGQAESTADTLGTEDAIDTTGGEVPVSQGQAESVADPLGGFDDEGTVPLVQQPPGTGAVLEGQRFGEQGVLRLGQQPRVGAGTDPLTGDRTTLGGETRTTIEGQDLPDADLGARGIDVDGVQAETGFPETNRAARGVEANQPGDIEQPLEDVDLQARGVRLQGEQVNEDLLDVRAERSRGVEPSEGPRAGPSEVPFQNVPGGGVLIIPGTGAVAPGAGQRQAGARGQPGGLQAADVGELQAGAGAPLAGQGLTAAGTGIEPAMTGELEAAEEYSRVNLTGRVAQVSYSDSMAQVVTDDHGVVTVRARPQEIALLQPGDFVALDVQRVGQSVWLSPAERFEPASADVTAAPGTGALSRDVSSPIFEGQGEIAGVITAINPDGGLVQVGGRSFQAHPVQLRGLEPGQMVSVSYGTVAGEDWAADIRVGAGAEEIARDVERPDGETAE